MASGIALLSGPQDPSQLDAVLNSLIESLNAYLTGQTPIPAPIFTGTTGSTLPNSGIVTLGTTAAGAYTMATPVPGNTVTLTQTTTYANTVTGLFEGSKTVLTFGSSLSVQTVMLQGLSTAAWAITSNVGSVASS